jgi:ABC-2 type transport system permease protein/ribosome-dependent ATPase
MNVRRVLALARKEWRETVRDRAFLVLAFLMPIVLMLAFGYGISHDVRHVPLAVVDYDRTAASRSYADHFAHSEYFDFRGWLESENDARARLSGASSRVIIVIPPGFHEKCVNGRTSDVQVLVDGSYTTTRFPRAIEAYLTAINAAASSELQVRFLVRRFGVAPDRARTLLEPLELDVRYLYNPALRSRWSMAPSLIMFVIVFVAPLLISLATVRERESGTILNIQVSTLGRGEFLAGKLLPSLGIAALNTLALFLLATWHFGAPFKGSFACFATGSLLYVLSVNALGLVLALLVRTQQTVLIIVGVLSSLLGTQYSGMLVPVPSMSGFSRALAHAFPPMYYLDLVHATFLKGLGFAALWPKLLVLLAFAVAYLALARALFHKRVRT